MGKQRNYSRPVSIIGVGQSDFTLSPDLPHHELYAWAGQAAMEDAGLKPQDIQKVVTPNFSSYPFMGQSLSLHVSLADWLGLGGLPNCHHEEGCASGYVAMDEAVQSVASGMYDIVMVIGVEMCELAIRPGKPSYDLCSVSELPRFDANGCLSDVAYTRFDGASCNVIFDMPSRFYAKENNLSDDMMDDILNAYAISARRNAHLNPHAILKDEIATVAKKLGFDDVNAYMKSKFNPKLSQFLRVNSMAKRCNAAAALIFCSSDIASSFKQKPITVLGTGMGCYSTGTPFHISKQCETAVKRCYEITGVRKEEIDYLQACDMNASEVLEAVQHIGYLGDKSWEHILDGQTAYDGEKPINTDGGYLARGHAYGVSGLASMKELVLQLRGQAGERQIKKPLKTAMLWGFGGSHTSTATILRNDNA